FEQLGPIEQPINGVIRELAISNQLNPGIGQEKGITRNHKPRGAAFSNDALNRPFLNCDHQRKALALAGISGERAGLGKGEFLDARRVGGLWAGLELSYRARGGEVEGGTY